MGFLDSYEDVAARIQRLHATHPTNRVETRIVEFSAQHGYVLVECKIFKEYEDAHPSAIDYAFGKVESYNPQMKRWFVEDTVTSAIGRAAGLLLGTDKRPTLQNMQQVEQMPPAFVNKVEDDPWAKPFAEEGFTAMNEAVATIESQLGGVLQGEAPICKHGHMILKEGTKANGDQYKGYVCPERVKANQCKALWLQIKSDGTWG